MYMHKKGFQGGNSRTDKNWDTRQRKARYSGPLQYRRGLAHIPYELMPANHGLVDTRIRLTLWELKATGAEREEPCAIVPFQEYAAGTFFVPDLQKVRRRLHEEHHPPAVSMRGRDEISMLTRHTKDGKCKIRELPEGVEALQALAQAFSHPYRGQSAGVLGMELLHALLRRKREVCNIPVDACRFCGSTENLQYDHEPQQASEASARTKETPKEEGFHGSMFCAAAAAKAEAAAAAAAAAAAGPAVLATRQHGASPQTA